MRRTLALGTSAIALTFSLSACGQAGHTDDTKPDTPSGRSISFDGVAVKLDPDVMADANIPFTLTTTTGDVRKADADFTMNATNGNKTVPLSKASCIEPGLDDIIPITFTPRYKDKATADIELGVSAHLEVEDAYGNELTESHPQGIGIAWLNTSLANCALSMEDKFSEDFAITDGYNLVGVIVLHGGRENYKGYTLKIAGGNATAVTNIKGDGAKPTYGGVEVPLLP